MAGTVGSPARFTERSRRPARFLATRRGGEDAHDRATPLPSPTSRAERMGTGHFPSERKFLQWIRDGRTFGEIEAECATPDAGCAPRHADDRRADDRPDGVDQAINERDDRPPWPRAPLRRVRRPGGSAGPTGTPTSCACSACSGGGGAASRSARRAASSSSTRSCSCSGAPGSWWPTVPAARGRLHLRAGLLAVAAPNEDIPICVRSCPRRDRVDPATTGSEPPARGHRSRSPPVRQPGRLPGRRPRDRARPSRCRR